MNRSRSSRLSEASAPRASASSSGRRTSASLPIADSSRVSSSVALTRTTFSRKARTAFRCPSSRSGFSCRMTECPSAISAAAAARSVRPADASAGAGLARRSFLKRPKECRDKNLASGHSQIGWGAPVLWSCQMRAVPRPERAADRPSGRRKRAYLTWHRVRVRMIITHITYVTYCPMQERP